MNFPTIGGYTPIRFIQKGCFGSIQLVKHNETKMLYALKHVSTENHQKQPHEVESLETLRGKFGVLQYVTHTKTPWGIHLITKYVHGENLFDFIKNRGKLGVNETRRIFYDLCSIMKDVHKCGIVHRDLKPENIIIQNDGGTPVIVDWGMSFFPKQTKKRKACGSPQYASPEIVDGLFYQGPEVDVWSLGVILYVMLTGLFPYEHSDIPRLFVQIRKMSPPYNSKSLSPGSINLLRRIFITAKYRITLEGILSHRWLLYEEDL